MVSVIICTYNPREDYLTRVLEALRIQTVPLAEWELILVDNASTNALKQPWDLSWHPHGKTVREESLGLTKARLRGIQESNGALLIFVDDDNVVAHNYLSAAIAISSQHPHIGAFGGSAKPEFEGEPPAWMRPYIGALAVGELGRDNWSNVHGSSDTMPIGAGLCVRREVAEDYYRKVNSDPLRTALGRIGNGLGSCEDIDLAWCAIDLGMGTGRFQALELTHLIPARRLTKDYLTRTLAGTAASFEILWFIRSNSEYKVKHEHLKFLWHMFRGNSVDRQIEVATWRARRQARKIVSARSKAAHI